MFLSDLSIKRPVLISMVLVVFVLFGALAYFSLNLNLVPEAEFPFITVQTIYPGAGPREIETQVSKRIEDAVSTISKIQEIVSYSMEGVSYVTIMFDLGKDIDIANQEVKDKVDGILSFLPDNSEPPIIQKFDIGAMPILDIVLAGNLEPTDLYDIADKRLRDRFSQIEGVARVDITGGEEREIRIEFENRIVFQNSISLVQLAGLLQAQNLDMPGGHFAQRDQEYSVRLKGEVGDIRTIGALKVPTEYGPKRVADIATIYDTGAEVRTRTSYFDNVSQERKDNVILLSLVRSSDGNTARIARAVKQALPEMESELPAGSSLVLVGDASRVIEGSVNDTLTNILLGVALTGLVLLFFLHDVRSTVIVALSMPMSILSTFLLMQISGFTLNLFTLMGISTAVGILVTNSVVVLENIFRHKQMGHGREESASKGTAEIAVAVIASTMTNIVVFLPIAFMTSMIGMFFREFALTVVFATLFSLLMSFTLTPMMASLILKEGSAKKNRIGTVLEGLFSRLEASYRDALSYVIGNKKHSALVVGAAVAMFIASLGLASKVSFEFVPTMDEGDIKIEVEIPLGASLDETAKLLEEVENRVREHPEVKHLITTVGKLSDLDIGTNMARMDIKLVDAGERDISTDGVVGIVIRDLSDIPNALIRVAALSSIGGGGGAPVTFNLMGQNVDTLEVYRQEVLRRIRDVDGLVNINTSSRPGKPEITLTPDCEKLAAAGLRVYDLAMALRGAIEGLVATSYRDQGEEYDIRVAMTDQSVDTPGEVGNISVVGPEGTYRLSQLADIEFTEGYSRILRMDKYKLVEFGGDIAPGYVLGDVTGEIDRRLEGLTMPTGYKVEWGGMAEHMQETTADMLRTFLLALVLTYMLLAAILESLTQPLLILGTVPLALIGVLAAVVITGVSMSAISMMAVVMLLGIVVNNAILMLDYTNTLVRRRGKSLREALLEACPTKLKPIIMASSAIILGMLPMALGVGDWGREIRQPMGIVSIGGVVVSTILTLFVIPALHYLTSRRKRSQHDVAGD
ncbi:MAG: efflux RND transporter permease subunit [Candidatus Eisenbacteria bacterium]